MIIISNIFFYIHDIYNFIYYLLFIYLNLYILLNLQL